MTQSKIRVTVVHPSTQYAPRLAEQLHRHGMLLRFIGGAVLHPSSLVNRFLEISGLLAGFRKPYENRLVRGIPMDKLATRAAIEIAGQLMLRGGLRPISVYRWRNELFQRSVPSSILRSSDVIVGFDTSSRLVARKAKALGKRFILDQSIGHPRSLRTALARFDQIYPAWSAPAERKTDGEIALEDEEHELADRIVVPSSFAAYTLIENGVPSAKIVINPFGTDTSAFRPFAAPAAREPVTFLFLGNFSARKGVPILLDAWNLLDTSAARLILAGTGQIPLPILKALPKSIDVVGALPRSALNSLFAESDVFVFPSLFEGLAQVQLEAAASGLPIIGTRSSGADHIVEPDVTGFLVPEGNAAALASRMESLIRDPGKLLAMRIAAHQRSRRWDWNNYGDRWANFLDAGCA